MKIITGDCLTELPKLEKNSVHSLITDPPAAISFMEKLWDSDKGGRDKWCEWLVLVMKECHRVMKPGAYGFVWSLPRKSHWVMDSVEKAGFEIKDIIHHLQGNGFPTGADISKEIDKKAGAERKVLGRNERLDKRYNVMITEPATDEAKKWDGWKTKLKPAVEHWIMIQKPIQEYCITENVLVWEAGALNTKACETPTGGFPTNAVLSNVDLGKKQTTYFNQFNEPWMYCARPHHNERNKGLENEDKINTGATDEGKVTASNTAKGPKNQLRKDDLTISANHHPTVKPIELMRWMCKMITPPGGIVLDPFLGSGTTAIAAKLEGLDCVGIELNQSYVDMANKRISVY